MNRRPTQTNGLTQAMWALILLATLVWTFPYPPSTAQQGMGPGPGVKSYGTGEVNFVNDTFTEGSDTVLGSHTGELGATWTQHPSYQPNAVTIDAATDEAYLTADPAAYYASGVPPSADYCVEGVIKVTSVVSANTAITWRVDTAANTKMIFQLNNGTGWRMRKIVAGTQTTIGSEDTTTNIPTVGQTRTMKACSSGNTHTAYINGVQLGTVGGTDSSVTAAGRAGVRFVGLGSVSTGYHIESFRAFTP